jgi:hypothetical protein
VTLAAIARRHGRSGWRHGAGFLLAGLLFSFGITGVLASHGDGGEGASAQLRLGQAYDLAGALARQPDLQLPALAADPALDRALRHAPYTPLRVDPMSADPAVMAALETSPRGLVGHAWRELVLRHPDLYLPVRWADFLAVLLTPDPNTCHFAPVGRDGDPVLAQSLGLPNRIRPQDHALAVYARAFFGTPVYFHPAWAVLALALLVLLLRRRAPSDLAVAGLLAGALLFTLTFAIISIACDYRYLLFLDLSALSSALYFLGTAKRV